ncbi:MAG: TonB-dependent receptor, partial [Sphingomonas bacterium]|nr:TonB-dependent receptor [Sphingomonas bacterium]
MTSVDRAWLRHSTARFVIALSILAPLPAAMAAEPATPAAPAAAPDQPAAAPEDTSGEVIVTGYRSSLANALGQKRASNQIIDAISAEDIA